MYKSTVMVLVSILSVITAADAAVILSGTDHQAQRTTLAVDASGKGVIVMWSSKDFGYGNEHLRFNRSADGGSSWMREPMDFALNSGSHWFPDRVPELAFDRSDRLHILWSRNSDKESPCYAFSDNYGTKWSRRKSIGGGHLPRLCGLGMNVSNDGKVIHAFYNDYDWHSYECLSKNGGKSWEVIGNFANNIAAGHPAKGYCSSILIDGEFRYVLRKKKWADKRTGIRRNKMVICYSCQIFRQGFSC